MSVCLSIYLCIYVSIYLSIHLSIYIDIATLAVKAISGRFADISARHPRR